MVLGQPHIGVQSPCILPLPVADVTQVRDQLKRCQGLLIPRLPSQGRSNNFLVSTEIIKVTPEKVGSPW